MFGAVGDADEAGEVELEYVAGGYRDRMSWGSTTSNCFAKALENSDSKEKRCAVGKRQVLDL